MEQILLSFAWVSILVTILSILGATVHVFYHFFRLFLESEDINFCLLTVKDLGSLDKTWLAGFMVEFVLSH